MKKVLFLLLAASGGFYGFKASQNTGPSSYQVSYSIECSDCDISYKNADEETVYEKNVSSSWSHKFTGKPGQFVYVAAQNNGDDSPIAVRITANEETIAEGNSEQRHVLATAGSVL